MPDIITDDIGISGGEPVINADTKSTVPNTGGVDKSEVINGYDVESPRTERIPGIGDAELPRPRRGRPPGSRNTGPGKSNTEAGDAKTKVRLDSFSIEGLLIGIHQMGAAMLKTPELEISKDEAKQLSDAVQAVAKEYNHVINPKTAAWIQLCVACGAVYGARIVAVRMREKQAKKAKVHVMPATPPIEYVQPEPIERDGGI